MTRPILISTVLAATALGGLTALFLSAAPERTAPQPLAERVASGAASLMMRGIAAGYAARTNVLVEEAQGAPVIVHVTFRALGDLDAFAARMTDSAPFLAHVPGLVWKVWALDPVTGDASGTYLFETVETAEMYLSDILPEGMGNRPDIADVDIRVTPVLQVASRLTHAPFEMAEVAQ